MNFTLSSRRAWRTVRVHDACHSVQTCISSRPPCSWRSQLSAWNGLPVGSHGTNSSKSGPLQGVHGGPPAAHKPKGIAIVPATRVPCDTSCRPRCSSALCSPWGKPHQPVQAATVQSKCLKRCVRLRRHPRLTTYACVPGRVRAWQSVCPVQACKLHMCPAKPNSSATPLLLESPGRRQPLHAYT